MAFHRSMLNLPGAIILQKTVFSSSSSQQLTIVDGATKSETSHLPFFSTLIFDLVWAYTGLTHANTVDVRCEMTCDFSAVSRRHYSQSLALTLSLNTLLQLSLIVGRKQYDIYVPFQAKSSPVSYFLYSGQLWALIATYYTQKSL